MEEKKGPVYNIPKEEVEKKLKKIRACIMDFDNTLIDYSQRISYTGRAVTWRMMEIAAGHDKNEKYRELLKRWFELSPTPEMAIEKKKEFDKVRKELDSLWKGIKLDVLKTMLYPLPYSPGAQNFLDKLRVKKTELKLISAIISSGPDFIVKNFADEYGMDYSEGCIVGVKEGILTGEFISTGLHGRQESIEIFCKKFNLSVDQIIYTGDCYLDVWALKNCLIGVAFNPEGGLDGPAAKAADVIIFDWEDHPLAKFFEGVK
jgi:phosphoserine phosphatase